MSAAAKALHPGVQDKERIVSAEYYRAEIDGLRGIAVLAVVGFHAFPDDFPGGFVGVDVFFVISGFLISTIILRQLRRSTFTLADFYARRMRRIFPALLVVLSACLLFGSFVLLPDELEQLGKHIGSAAIFVSNFTLWRESGYFDTVAQFKPLLHLWSLGIEEQFYLIWPMLLMLLWRRPRRARSIVVLLTIASFALSLTVGSRSSVAAFYLPFTRFWELGSGCALAVLRESPAITSRWFGDLPLRSSRYGRLPSMMHTILPIVGIVLIGFSILLFDRRTAFPGWATLLPTAGAMCIIAARGDSWFQRRVMASAGLVFVGVVSYPLYLWHWPMLSFAAILDDGTPDSAVRAVAVLLSFALAWLTFILFERPIRAQRSSRVSVALAAGLLMLGTAGLVMYAARGFPQRFNLDVQALRPEPRTDLLCPDEFRKERVFNYCKSTQSAPAEAVFLGDSRAQGVYDGVADLLGTRYALMLLARGGCPPMLGVNLHYIDQEDCMETWKLFVKYVERVRPPVVVVVGGGSNLLHPSEATLESASHFATREDAFKQGLRELIVALGKTSHVIYIRQLPQFQSAPSCFLRPIRLPGSQCSASISRSTIEAATASYDRILGELRDEIPELRVVDSLAALCNEVMCSQRLPSGEIIYSDQIHLNPAGGRHFARASALVDLIENELASVRRSSMSTDPDIHQ